MFKNKINKIYDKGYSDGFSDALNNLTLDDVLENIPNFSVEERQKIIKAIENCKWFVGNIKRMEEYNMRIITVRIEDNAEDFKI